MKTDTLFYRLFSYLPSLVFDLVDLGVTETQGYQFSSEEIKQTAFRLDGILKPPSHQIEKPLVFLEVQFQADEDFYSRFFSELFLYIRQKKPQNPWQGVVIYPNRKIERFNNPQHYQVLLDSLQVHILYLEDILSLKTDNLGVQLLQLIQSDKQAVDKANSLIANARKEIKSKLELEQLLEFIETIVVSTLPKLSREEVRKMLNFTDADLRQTQFYKDVFEEGKEEGKEESKEEKKEDVKNEGLKILLMLTAKYYGELDELIINKIEQLSLERINELITLLIYQQDNFSLETLTSWLSTPCKH